MKLEAINLSLFQSLNAPDGFSGAPLALAIAACKYPVVILLALLAFLWMKRIQRDRAFLISIGLAVVVALAINYVVGAAFPHPRPFMVGLGRTFLPHVAESSFPSDHATLMWTIAFGLLLHSSLRSWGWLAALLAAVTSWARVFLGLHFPFDILGSVMAAVSALALLSPMRPWIERKIAPVVEGLYLRTMIWIRQGLAR